MAPERQTLSPGKVTPERPRTVTLLATAQKKRPRHHNDLDMSVCMHTIFFVKTCRHAALFCRAALIRMCVLYVYVVLEGRHGGPVHSPQEKDQVIT